MKTTNAIRFHDYGGPEVMKLEQIACPEPKDDEILVRVHAMGVNPVDWKVREGLARKRLNIALPAIPGGDISGVVEQIGSAARGVSVGQSVFAMIGLLGAYSEHVAIKAAIAAPKPSNLDHVQAASVPLAALTAWKGLFEVGGLQRGQRVLIHAGAGRRRQGRRHGVVGKRGLRAGAGGRRSHRLPDRVVRTACPKLRCGARPDQWRDRRSLTPAAQEGRDPRRCTAAPGAACAAGGASGRPGIAYAGRS
jgi:hypothetical protein